MRFYIVGGGGPSQHFSTMVEAKRELSDRVRSKSGDWRDMYIDEVEVPLSKENVLRLLNEEGGTHQYMRQWGATQRGGIKLQDREEF